jgi:membrane-associated phospholipid phosphatase
LAARHRLQDRRLLPFALSLGLAIVTLSWNGVVGLSWRGPTLGTLLLASSPLLLIAGYAAFRGVKPLVEAILFGYTYLVVPLIGVRLSYLVTTLNFPLVDAGLTRIDHTFGFDWLRWADFINSHPAFHAVTFTAYMSPIVQALVSAAIFSHVRPGKRNAEMLFTLVLGLILVILIYTFFPELGPASLVGEHNQMEASILALRAGSLGPLPYVGIVSFPSYHTVMAIVFTFSHRRLRSFWPVALLNTLMLFGTPTFGDHYFTDMLGGTLVAAFAILLGHKIYGISRDEILVPAGTPAWSSIAAE